MADKLFISKITLPTGEGPKTYELKDLEARDLIETLSHIGLSFIRSTNAANTPLGVVWVKGSELITGTLAPSAEIKNIYLVPEAKVIGKSTYIEYVCVIIQEETRYTAEEAAAYNTEHELQPDDPDYKHEGDIKSEAVFAWESIGSTDASLDELGDMAYADTATGTATFTGHTGIINSTGTFTAHGTVSTPIITVDNTDTTSFTPIDSVGSLPSFTEGTFTQGTLPSKEADVFTQGTLPTKDADTWNAGTLPNKEADVFTQGSLPSKAADTFTAGSTPLEMEVSGETLVFTLGTAPSYQEGAFNQGTLPTFTEGAFSKGTLPSFTEGTFNAGTLPTFTEGTFHAGDLPTKAPDTWDAGALPTKAAQVTVLQSVSATSSQPTFTGDAGEKIDVSTEGVAISTTGTLQVHPDVGNH